MVKGRNKINDLWNGCKRYSSTQSFNRRIQNNNTSGVKGVSWDKRTNRWMMYYGKKWVGRFDTIEECVEKRTELEIIYKN